MPLNSKVARFMHKEHPVFKKPADENAKIWRYMDFTQFVSLIDRQALFFTRTNCLDDKFEGTLSKHVFDPLVEEQATEEQRQQLQKVREQSSIGAKFFREWTFVNCWHMNEYESAAMWKLHLKSDEGVAIQSTYRRLADSFKKDDPTEIWIGTVNYIDYEREHIPIENGMYPFIYKRKSFEHEKELRAVIWYRPQPQPVSTSNGSVYRVRDCDILLNGFQVPVDLERLVETVYVSPTAQDWFEDLVKSVMTKYDCGMNVTKSSLADDPIF